MASVENCLTSLINIGILKIGNFILKSGGSSPIYVDLRSIISYPDQMKTIVEMVRNKQNELGIAMDVVCGVPYTALPIASVFSVEYSVPMIMKRKEAKSYGTKKMVEGVFEKGSKCLIIEDIVSSGSSIIETVEELKREGLVVTDCICILNRKQGGTENLAKCGINLHALFDIYQLFEKYCSLVSVGPTVKLNVINYLKDNFIPVKDSSVKLNKPFNQRAELCTQPILKRLFHIIHDKETNLCVSADVTQSEELLKLVENVGPYICILKTHIDILTDFKPDVLDSLKSLAMKFNFLIMEDRKFADIGNTSLHQYSKGMYHICEWADIITVHGVAGSAQIDGLKSAVSGQERAAVLIAELSSKGALTDESYTKKVVDMAKQHPDFVIGFVCQHKLVEGDNIIHMTPGVNISNSGDSYGQQYNSPEAVMKKGTDVIIVGRGIAGSTDVVKAAIQYKTAGYEAYIKTCVS